MEFMSKILKIVVETLTKGYIVKISLLDGLQPWDMPLDGKFG